MPKFTTGQLKLYLRFGAAVLVGGGVTAVLSRIGVPREWGAPEFLLFTRRLGWTVIASGAVWETIAFMKLLLCFTETNTVSRHAKEQPQEQAGQC